MNRAYLALALTLVVIASSASGSVSGLGAHSNSAQVPVVYDDSSGSVWRDMGAVRLLNNGTHVLFEIGLTGPAPAGGGDIEIFRYLTVYADTDGNSSTGLELPAIYYGADFSASYGIRDSGTPVESVNTWAYLPNGTRVALATNYTAHFTDSDLSITLPTPEIGAAGSTIRVIWLSYLAVSYDHMPDTYNVSIPQIPQAPAENDSKWEGVYPVIVDSDQVNTSISSLANATKLYLGVSGDLLCVRVYNNGYDATIVSGGGDVGYVTLTFDMDIDNDLNPDLRFYFNRYFSNSVYVSIYNFSSREWIRGRMISDYTDLGDYVEFDINMSKIGLSIGGNVSIMGTNYMVITGDYAGARYIVMTKFILWPNTEVKVLEPLRSIAKTFTNQFDAALGPYRVITRAMNQSTKIMASFTLYDTNPSYALRTLPSGGNVSEYLTIHYKNSSGIEWPVTITYQTPSNTSGATAYYINIENGTYTRFANQSFDPNESKLTLNMSEDEYRRPEGEVTIVVTYAAEEQLTTTTTTSAPSTTIVTTSAVAETTTTTSQTQTTTYTTTETSTYTTTHSTTFTVSNISVVTATLKEVRTETTTITSTQAETVTDTVTLTVADERTTYSVLGVGAFLALLLVFCLIKKH